MQICSKVNSAVERLKNGDNDMRFDDKSGMEKDTVFCGVKIGEHSFCDEEVMEEVQERVIATGCNLVYIRPGFNKALPQEAFIKWAKFLAEQEVYFHFGYTAQYPPDGRESHFDPETVAEMKRIAGKFFWGDAISEPGTTFACKAPGYFRAKDGREKDAIVLKTDCEDMAHARANYVNTVRKFADRNKGLGMPQVLGIEATALTGYNMEAGVNFPILEVMNGNPDDMLASVRGAARAYEAKMWGTLIAHEWYGGFRHEDILKRKRLELAWKYAYLAGANTLMLESGDTGISSYGYRYEKDSVLAQEYGAVIRNMAEFVKKDARPRGGPKVKLAFVIGNHDAWTGFCQSSVWNQFYREEWGHGAAEYSWRILGELGTKRKWADSANYGDYDTSAYPAYGMYDLVPIAASVDVLLRYEYLIFLGWNSMTDEIMDKLTEYTERGGKLLMSAAHLNCNVSRDGNVVWPSEEKMKKLFGCRLTGKTKRTNEGTKFRDSSLNEEILYPGSKSFICDPVYSAGYTEYPEAELCGAVPAGSLSDNFWFEPMDTHSVIENKIGKGVATLVMSLDYPGHPAVYPLYSAMVREFVSASARNCDIRVIGSDRLRYAVYGGDKLYLLNTDYDLPITVKIIRDGLQTTVTLESLELRTLQL